MGVVLAFCRGDTDRNRLDKKRDRQPNVNRLHTSVMTHPRVVFLWSLSYVQGNSLARAAPDTVNDTGGCMRWVDEMIFMTFSTVFSSVAKLLRAHDGCGPEDLCLLGL